MATKIPLPNGCYCSALTVTPKGWDTKKGGMSRDWYISYRFTDPNVGKPIRQELRGMNDRKVLAHRQAATQHIINLEMGQLLDGYNPVTKKTVLPVNFEYEIKPSTLFITAINKCFDRMKLKKLARYSMKSCIKYVSKAINQLRLNALQIDQVRRVHIKLILEQCEKNQPRWSAQTYNHYRAYLMMIFVELVELNAIELNPLSEIKKMPVPHKIKPTLTLSERARVDAYLRYFHPDYRIWFHCFYHSSSRITEIGKIVLEDVDFDNQRFKIWILKRKVATQVWKPMKNIAVEFWKEAVKDCLPGQFVFAHSFLPGDEKPLPQYFTDFWRENIKKDLRITADLYSMKHLHSDEVAKITSLSRAKDFASHTSEKTTLIYAQGQYARDDEDLKVLDNPFV